MWRAPHIPGVGWQVDNVRGVDHIGVRYQRIADRRQQGCHRPGVPGMAANFRPDAGRHQQHGVKLAGIFPGAAAQLKQRRHPVPLQTRQHPHFTLAAPFPRRRNRQAYRNFPRLQLGRHAFPQLCQQVGLMRRMGNKKFPLKQDWRHKLPNGRHNRRR